MHKYFAVMVVTLGGVSVQAADCTVTGNTVTCGPGETYAPGNHNNKPLDTYEQVVLHRTAANTHGYVQYSNKTFFKDVLVTVEGSRGDGITLRNFGPEADFDNLTVNALGFSGDGINLGRDNSSGRVRVHKSATINSAQGMGVRSVSAEGSLGDHIITFNGSSTISTKSAGSDDAGHAVFAGTQSKGCGPFGLPLFDCKAVSRGEVHLLGGEANQHVVETAGAKAHGLYASGRGSIVADNISVTTQADQAHGIFAERINDDFYRTSQDQGSQDYAGNVELRGDVQIAVAGLGSYALMADSKSAQSGGDSEGNIASIRSFDSSTGNVVADKLYRIQGDLYATNSGLIDVSMGAGSQFTGSTLIDNNGVMNLHMAGPNSVWHLTGSSSLSALTLSQGARLNPISSASPALSSHTVQGKVINNAGLISLASNSLVGDTLTIDGDYVSDQGQVTLNTFLSDDNSPVDKLVVTGDASGHGVVRLADLGGAGGVTDQGIQLIQIQGRSNANFKLEGDYIHQGEQAVVVGAYAYKLRKGEETSLGDGHWYLLSDLKPQPAPDPTPDPKPEPPPPPKPKPQPNYHAGTPAYEVYPQLLLALNALPTLRQRLGERYWNPASGSEPAAFNASDAKQGPWIRVAAGHEKIKPRSSTTQSTYKYDNFSMQAGVDKVVAQSPTAQVLAGLSVLYGHTQADLYSVHSNGDIKTDSYGVAANLTWHGGRGFYIDAQAQKNWFESRLYSALGHKDLSQGKNRGHGYAMSVEAGKSIYVSDTLSITPQAQLQYNKVTFNDFSTQWQTSRSRVSYAKGDSVLARLGLSVDYQQDLDDGSATKLYGVFNIYNEFTGKTKVKVASTYLSNQSERLTGSVGMGGLYSWNDGKYAIYGEGSVSTSLRHFSDSYGYRGSVGVRLLW